MNSKIQRLQLFYCFAFHSRKIHSLEPAYISSQLIGALKNAPRQLPSKKESVYLYLNGTDYEIWIGRKDTIRYINRII